MGKIKLTKGELKRQRDSLAQFQRYLPTLQLKKQQLQTRILQLRKEADAQQRALKALELSIEDWIGLLGDPELPSAVDLRRWLVPEAEDVVVNVINIAGANVPSLREIRFAEPEYDYYIWPFWIDAAIEKLRDFIKRTVELLVARRAVHILEHELRTTTQRVNLFEKVKIPESQENIRRIRIYLGDQQANAVGISKAAKRKTEERIENAMV